MPGAVLAPIGPLPYGWSAQARLHWVVPKVGAAIFTAGSFVGRGQIDLYLIDYYRPNAVSAQAAASFVLSVFSTVFPLFGPAFYERVGYGWAKTAMAGVSVVIGWPAPFLLWKYGKKLRDRNRYAVREN